MASPRSEGMRMGHSVPRPRAPQEPRTAARSGCVYIDGAVRRSGRRTAGSCIANGSSQDDGCVALRIRCQAWNRSQRRKCGRQVRDVLRLGESYRTTVVLRPILPENVVRCLLRGGCG